MDFHSFYKVLRKVNLPPGGTFYDLGSGTGKAVFAARLVCDFDRCVGVEILEGLHNQGQAIVKRYCDRCENAGGVLVNCSIAASVYELNAPFQLIMILVDSCKASKECFTRDRTRWHPCTR